MDVAVYCDCGRTVVKTSWTDLNPGRRFRVCPNSERRSWRRWRGGCGFWEWVDPEMCPRAVEIIPGLIRRIDAMEFECDSLQRAVEGLESNCGILNAKVVELEDELATRGAELVNKETELVKKEDELVKKAAELVKKEDELVKKAAESMQIETELRNLKIKMCRKKKLIRMLVTGMTLTSIVCLWSVVM